ncbi:hypothetical protein LRH25_12350 [Ideonella azotifigens]|nr:hypothetical protein [Ideonella azotifigens]
MAANDFVQRAEHLLDLWSSLSMLHVALGAGCGCGIGGISLRLDDFELDIVDYLGDTGVRSGVPEVAAFFVEQQQRAQEGSAMGTRAQPLRHLLDQARRERLPLAVTEWLLPKVEKTLRSYAELHGPKLEG